MSKSSAKVTLKNVVSDADRALLEERYEFVPSQSGTRDSTWQDRMVQRYNDGLYKEYALADLSRPGQLGLRWRTRPEVMDGRGERSCGNKRCFNSGELVTIEVPFAYHEGGVQKKELVKLCLCPACLPLVQARSSSKSSNLQERKKKSLKEQSMESSATLSDNDSYDEEKKRKRKKHKRRSKEPRKEKRQRSHSG